MQVRGFCLYGAACRACRIFDTAFGEVAGLANSHHAEYAADTCRVVNLMGQL